MQKIPSVISLISEIKESFIAHTGCMGNEIYDKGNYNSCLERWITELNIQEYNDFISVLQTNQYKNRVLLRYGIQDMAEGLWSDKDSIYRECRSVVINIETEKIALRPFRKFFNVNEVEENKEDVLRAEILAAEVFEIADKLDGSMQNASIDDGELVLTGSQALDPSKSWRLKKGYEFLSEPMKVMIFKNADLTFSFEFICKEDQHVVDYSSKKEGLYLIGIRNKDNGYQFSYTKVKEFGDFFNVPTVDVETHTFDELLEKMKVYKSNEKEGWVLWIDGRLVKLKCDDYVFMHRTMDKLASPNVVIQCLIEGNYDDLYAKSPDSVKSVISSIKKDCDNYITLVKNEIETLYTQRPSDEKRDFMVWANAQSKELKGYLIRKYLKQPFNVLTSGGKNKKIAEIREKIITE